jgi:phosphatidylglycerol:prolipoprotein diacylglycerol transferase
VKVLYIENISPVIFTLGPLTVRWYGLLMAVSAALGIFYLLKNGKKQGLDEGSLLNLSTLAILCAAIGARTIYVLTNWSYFSRNLAEIIRVDKGGLAFHGALLGGFLSVWLYTKKNRINFGQILDLAVPGITIAYMLVRIANITNQEILGRTGTLLPFDRHPAQIYGSLIGLTLLLVHNRLARTRSFKPGGLFWSFVLFFSLLRGLIEETFRDNPLYLWGYVNESWGVGFFTLTHLITPFLVILAWRMIWQRKKERIIIKSVQ